MRILLLALALIAQPAFAGSIAEGTEPIIYFKYHDPDYPVVACIKPENIPKTDGPWFPFNPENGDRVAKHWKFNANTLVYSPPPPPLDPPPPPNPDAFIDAVAADPSVNTGSFLIALKVCRIKDDNARKTEWASKGLGIPTPQKQVIENAAAAAAMPLR